MTTKKEVAKKAARPGTNGRLSGHTPHGQEFIADLEALASAIDQGGMEAVRKRFKITTLNRAGFQAPFVSAADVAAIRAELAITQATLAGLLGVSLNTIQAWEQGVNPVSGVASRFLYEISHDPEYWKKRIAAAARVTAHHP